ncbi:MAG: disulfide bond formation protein B [Pseudomonadota bacterium]
MLNSVSKKNLVALAALGSVALLAGAFLFQALGYAPCKMCYWQRHPHGAAAVIGAVFLFIPLAILPWLGALAAALTGGVGVFHAGVEQKWWDGPSSCSGGGAGLTGLSGSDLLSTEVIDRVVMCDEISWQLLGLSMPAWNAVWSFALVVLWLVAARRATQ